MFLDEIGNIPLHLQAKLLRVLQNRTVTRVGSEKQIEIDIRLICATNMNLEKMVHDGHFREDLYYRINTVQMHLPPLRNRAEDILPLAELFLKKYAVKYHRPVETISEEAALRLTSHAWSGNIRELQNVIEKAVVLSEEKALLLKDLSMNTPAKATSTVSQTLDKAEEKTIRVLTHEIMNTVSPIASLSEALSHSANVPEEEREMDVKAGLETIASSSKDLIRFVESYRELAGVILLH